MLIVTGRLGRVGGKTVGENTDVIAVELLGRSERDFGKTVG